MTATESAKRQRSSTPHGDTWGRANELPDTIPIDSAIQERISIPPFRRSRNAYTLPSDRRFCGGVEVSRRQVLATCCMTRHNWDRVFYGISIQTGIDRIWCYDCAAPCGYQNGDHWEEDGYADENARWVVE